MIMFNFKNNFLKNLESFIVFLSFIIAANGDSRTCYNKMLTTFGQSNVNNTLKCIQIAITKMKLYGEHKISYDGYVTTYYEQLHKFLNPDPILLPSEFCKQITCDFNFTHVHLGKSINELEKDCKAHYQRCVDELTIFEIDEELLPGLSSLEKSPTTKNTSSSKVNVDNFNDLMSTTQAGFTVYVDNFNDLLSTTRAGGINIPKSSTLYVDNFNDLMSTRQADSSSFEESPTNITSSSSFEKSPTNITNLKQNILKNALYYHKQGVPRIKLTCKTKLYFHSFESYGYFYLDHIAEVIELIDVTLQSPWEFCTQKQKLSTETEN